MVSLGPSELIEPIETETMEYDSKCSENSFGGVVYKMLAILCRPQFCYLSGAETGIFWDNYANTVAADGMALSFAGSSVLTLQDKQILGFHKEYLNYLCNFKVEKW